MEKHIAERVERAIREKVFPGCVVGIVGKNGIRAVLSFGRFTYDENAPSVKEDTIYDVASLTKAVATGSLALTLIEQGKLELDSKLCDYLPEFNNSDREKVLIRHLLTYTLAGYGLGRLLADITDPKKLTEYVLHRDFDKPPGTVFEYSNIPAFLLGLAVERIAGESLDMLADKYFFQPLGMSRTTFFPERFSKNEIVPTEIDHWRGLVQGVVHDESAYLFKTVGNKTVGHAGLFSTAGDLLTFMEMLLHGGTLRGRTYFKEETVGQMETNQIPELNDFTGLGWELNQPRFMGKSCTEHTFGKTGFTGTLCICDRRRGVAYVILSNRIYPQRPADSSAINAVRADIGEIILGSTF